MEYYIDREGTTIHKGDQVQVVDRVKTHEGKNLDLVVLRRVGTVVESRREGYVRVQLNKVHKPEELCAAASFFPEELKVVKSFGGESLAYNGIQKLTKTTEKIREEKVKEEDYIETESPGWRISPQQYKHLLSYVGCGNFPEADILFFGNEEGTGTYSIEANVEARVNTFGKEKNTSEYTYKFDHLPENGYWEPSAVGGRDKIIHYLKTKGIIPKYSDQVRSSFLKSIARIILALENSTAIPVENWFEDNDSKKMLGRVSSFAMHELFCPRIGLQTALMDWRHLPRPKEGAWYGEYTVSATIQNRYLRAYNQFAAEMKDEFSDYSADVVKRKQVLLNAIEHSSATVLIGLGGANGFKKHVLSHMFDVSFEPVDLGHGIFMNKAQVQMQNKNMNIFLLPFPSAQVYGSQLILKECLKKLVKDHLVLLVGKNY